jgi:hypothetical protein
MTVYLITEEHSYEKQGFMQLSQAVNHVINKYGKPLNEGIIGKTGLYNYYPKHGAITIQELNINEVGTTA